MDSVTMCSGASSAQMNIGLGTTISLNGDVAVNSRPVANGVAASVAISGQGSLALPATRTFTVSDNSAANDLTIGTGGMNVTGPGGLTKAGANSRLALSG